MRVHAPTGRMKIVTNCERVQPFCTGVNRKGELVWEGRTMPRWQMEMLRVAVNWMSDFFTRWIELTHHQEKDIDWSEDGLILPSLKAATKQRIAEMRRMYPRKERRLS